MKLLTVKLDDDSGLLNEKSIERECDTITITFKGKTYKILELDGMLTIMSSKKIFLTPVSGCNVIQFE